MSKFTPAPFTDGADLQTDWLEEFFDCSSCVATYKNGKNRLLGFINDIPAMLSYVMFTNRIDIRTHEVIDGWHEEVLKRAHDLLSDSEMLTYAVYKTNLSVSLLFFYVPEAE